MTRPQRRLLLLVALLPLLVVAAAFVYMAGMGALEGRPRDFWTAVQFVAETLTTTGYGGDSQWSHPAMVLFVVALQFVGVFLIFLVFPVYVIPFLEERFEPRLPRSAPDVSDHVLIFRYGPPVETLLLQLEKADLAYVVLEHDEAEARRLLSQGRRVVYCPEGSEPLEAGGLARARAFVANGRDPENAGILLGVRQRGFQGATIALVIDPAHRIPMRMAGARIVFTPRHILAAALAARASDRISPRIAGIQQLGRRLEVVEVRLAPTSPLAGRTLSEAGIGARTGVTVIGQWVNGELRTNPGADTRLEPGGILVLLGPEERIERLEIEAEGATRLRRSGPFVVAGAGEVGRVVAELLREVDEEVRTVDREARPGVDLVGDVLAPATLEAADLRSARGVILALDSDDAMLFATMIAKHLAPDVPVIARINHSQNLQRIYQAGADFALSVAQVSGQMLARQLLGEEAVTIDPALKVVRAPAAGLAGTRTSDLALRERTGCSLVAVERGEEVLVELAPDLRIEADDVLFVCGSDECVRRFRAEAADAER